MKKDFSNGSMKWAEVAHLVEGIGEDVDWSDESFICNICEEPVYSDDYPEIPSEDGEPFCPICGSFFL